MLFPHSDSLNFIELKRHRKVPDMINPGSTTRGTGYHRRFLSAEGAEQ